MLRMHLMDFGSTEAARSKVFLRSAMVAAAFAVLLWQGGPSLMAQATPPPPPDTTPDAGGPASDNGSIVVPKKKAAPEEAPPPAPVAPKIRNPEGLPPVSIVVEVPEVTVDVGVLLEKTHQFVPNLQAGNFVV